MRRHESLRTDSAGTATSPSAGSLTQRSRSASSRSRIIATAFRTETSGAGRSTSRKIDLLIEQEPYSPFDAARAAAVARAPAAARCDEHVLLLVLHHAIADGWSIGILFEEFSSGYAALAGYPSVPLTKIAAGVFGRRPLAALVVRHGRCAPAGRRLE